MLKGYIDGATRDRLFGWVLDESKPDSVLCLRVEVDGTAPIRILADRFRADIQAAGFGRHAFELAFRTPLSPFGTHVVSVCVDETGEALPGSPVIVPASAAFDGAARAFLEAALPDCEDAAEIDGRIAFLQDQVLALRRVRAERAMHDDGGAAALSLRPGWTAVAEREETPGKPVRRALIIDEMMPRPGHDAGSNAILSHAASLQRLGYRVVLAAVGLEAGPAALHELGIATRHRPGCGSIEELLGNEQGFYDLVYLHRVGAASRYLNLVRHSMPAARVLYSVADLHHVRFARQAAAEDRPELVGLAHWVASQEFTAALGADAVLTHSAVEAEALRQVVPAGRVHVVPWAVAAAPGPGFEGRSGVAFVGHFAHEPNLNGALWLVDEIMPLLRAADPAMTCLLIGSAMPDVLRRARPGVAAVGAVADLGAALRGVRVTVASLAYGAGVKGKVLDSLAAGVPCVCTPVAAEGIGLGPALSGLVAGDGAGLAESVLRVHGDAGLWAACRAEGLALVAAEHGAARVDAALRGALGPMGG